MSEFQSPRVGQLLIVRRRISLEAGYQVDLLEPGERLRVRLCCIACGEYHARTSDEYDRKKSAAHGGVWEGGATVEIFARFIEQPGNVYDDSERFMQNQIVLLIRNKSPY